jgi:hypothetical protein
VLASAAADNVLSIPVLAFAEAAIVAQPDKF